MNLRLWHGAVVLATIAATAAILLLMGRIPICECGVVKLWYPPTAGPENSQHLADWYSFTHITHGFLFYFLAWLAFPRIPAGWRFIAAFLAEAAWEIGENNDFIIDRYRQTTVSVEYFGDSVINAVGDLLFMLVGLFLALRLPVRVSVGLAIGLEILAAFVIRDNLTLNVIMLIWPIEAVKQWQMALPQGG